VSRIPSIRRIAAALAGLACTYLGLAITASAAFAQTPSPPGYQAMPAALVRQALLHGEDLAPVSRSGSGLSFAAAATAALATGFPSPNTGGIYDPVQTSQAAPVVTVVGGGMPGWQIALIAAGAALLAATLAVLAYRVRAAHHRTLAIQQCDDGQRVPPGGVLELSDTPQDRPADDLLEQTGMHLRAERLTRPRN
jgi:hypothetical protein